MISFKDIESYWSEYSLGIKELSQVKNPMQIFQKRKDNHDEAYANANIALNLQSLKGQAVLELACGLGFDTIEFAKYAGHLTTIDLSKKSLSYARNYLEHNNFRPDFIVSNAEKLCFPKEIFDIVIARSILEYTLQPNRVVDEIYRVLKPNGRVQFLIHNRFSWYVFFAKIANKNLYNDEKDPPLYNPFTLFEVKKILKGFSNLKITFDRLPRKVLRRTGFSAFIFNYLIFPFLNLVPKKIFKNFGYYILVECTKAN